MNPHKIESHTFANGLTLVVEPMADVQSAAFSFLVPAGSIYDPRGRNGTAAVLREMITRGAGDRDNKQLSAALDNLGLERQESIGSAHISFTGAALAGCIPEALRIYGDIIRRPRLPETEFEAARDSVEQTLLSIEDEPRQKVMIELRRRCFDKPWGLPSEGDLNELPSLSSEQIRSHYARNFRPDGAILGVAGKIDGGEIRRVVEDVFGNWESKPAPAFEKGPHGPKWDHIDHDSTQTHIGIAYDSVPYRHPDYFAAWAAVSILSGGMSARLFTEVREKRGLCYSVQASLNSLRDEARVLCYAGTTAERAQETLDVTLAELQRLGEGIAEDELTRCKARAKSSLIMQQESTMARASSLSRDWYHLGRVMTLEEIRKHIEELTVPKVLDFVHARLRANSQF